MAKKYYQPEIETMPVEQLKALQSERLVKQVKHVWDNVPYYRAKMEEKGVTPDDIKGIEDLHKLPFVTKDDLREAYPYGLLAAPLKDCVRIHSTSGTTGKRVVAFLLVSYLIVAIGHEGEPQPYLCLGKCLQHADGYPQIKVCHLAIRHDAEVDAGGFTLKEQAAISLQKLFPFMEIQLAFCLQRCFVGG